MQGTVAPPPGHKTAPRNPPQLPGRALSYPCFWGAMKCLMIRSRVFHVPWKENQDKRKKIKTKNDTNKNDDKVSMCWVIAGEYSDAIRKKR